MAQRLATSRLVVRSLLFLVAVFPVVAGRTGAHAQAPSAGGPELWQESCASCHGPQGEGTDTGPPIRDAGAASADFQLRTGRMPLADTGAQAVRKDSPFTDGQIEQLVDYVASLGDGPSIPQVSLSGTQVAAGRELYAANCAPCHATTGTGGAVGPGALAPSVFQATPLEVAEAMISGPGEMPVFDLTEKERNDVVAFVAYLQDERDPGGTDIGGIGPVPEGYVAWLVGGSVIVVLCLFIGHTKRRSAGEESPEST